MNCILFAAALFASVQLPENPPRPVAYAAEELTNTLSRIYGKVPDWRIEFQCKGKAADDEFKVESEGDRLTLSGSSPRATLFAAYAFLQDWLDVRWFWPGESGEYLPKAAPAVLPKRERVYRSPFRSREMSICVIGGHRHEPTERWFAKMFLNSGLNSENVQRDLGLVIQKSGHWVSLPVNKAQRQKLFEAHPDWFSLLGGKRDISGIAGCWSNPGYYDYLVKELTALIRREHIEIANFFVADIIPRCECPECTVDPDLSARWWKFYAKLIAGIRKEIPAQRFTGLAYQEYRKVPGIKVTEVENVEYCQYNRCYFHPLESKDCPKNVASMAEFRRWGEQAPLGFYGYGLDIFKPWMYMPMWRMIDDEMKVFKKMSVKRVKTELLVERDDRFKCFRLPAYVWARLAFDPELDADAVARDFCERVYGAGAAEMYAYHELMAEAWSATKAHITYFYNSPRSFVLQLFSDETVRKATVYLEAARRATAGDGRAHGEVEFANKCFREWMDFRESAKKGGVELDLHDIRGDEAFNVTGWLPSKAKAGKSQKTRFKVYRGRDALHLLAECEEKENPDFNRGSVKHDDPFFNWNASSIEMFIDVGDGVSRQIAISPAGGVWDAADGDLKWESKAEARTSFGKDSWTMQIKLPYAQLGAVPDKSSKWKLMIIRNAPEASAFKSCGWPVNAHRDFGSAATVVFK